MTCRLTGAGFSIVRDDAGGTAIPVGGSREIEVAYAPTVAYTGAPSAVKHDWTNLVVQYRYSGGFLVGYWLYSGFQNTGGAGALGWRVRIGAQETTGSGAVVAGGRYIVQSGREHWVELRAGGGARAGERLPSTFARLARGQLQGVAYFRVPDAYLSIASNDDDEPDDRRRPVRRRRPARPRHHPAHDHRRRRRPLAQERRHGRTSRPVDAGGSGMIGGLAKTEYSLDGGASWTEGDHGRPTSSGSAAGARACTPCSTARPTPPATSRRPRAARSRSTPAPPLTTDDAPLAPQAGAVTVHLTAADSLFGVRLSGVASLTLEPRRRRPADRTGASASVPVSGAGLHWIAYYSTDNAGNAEYVKWCSVTILAGGRAKRATR